MPRDPQASKYYKVMGDIEGRIESGEYPPGMRFPPMIELYKHFGVSDSTLIRALDHLEAKGKIVRKRGSGVYISECPYPPLIPGRRLKLGLLLPRSARQKNFTSPNFMNLMVEGALSAWQVDGLLPQYRESPRQGSTEAVWEQPVRGLLVKCLGDDQTGRSRIPPFQAIKREEFDGLLTLGIIEEPALDRVLDLGMPAVLVDFPTQLLGNRADLVYADPQMAIRQVVDHLWDKGTRTIHFVGARVWDPNKKLVSKGKRKEVFGRRIDPDSFLRLSAFRQAMDAHGVYVPDAWVHFVSHEPGPHKALAKRLAELPAPDRPEAVICHQSSTASRLIEYSRPFGLNLQGAGGHTSVEPKEGTALPVRVDPYKMGAEAARLLLARLKNPEKEFCSVGVRMTFDPSEDVDDGVVASDESELLASDLPIGRQAGPPQAD